MAVAPQLTGSVSMTQAVPPMAPGLDWSRLGGIAGNLAQMGMTASKAPQITSQTIYTPEMLQAAYDAQMRFQNNQNNFYGSPYTGAGGATTRQASVMSERDVKAEEYKKYLISKGYTAQNAQIETNKILAGQKKFKDDKGFRQAINAGEITGLKVGKKKIKAEERIAPGGFSVSPESEALRQGMQGLSGQSIGAAQGLLPMLTGDVQRSLMARQGLQGQLGGLLGQGFTDTGLTLSEQANYDATKAKYMKDFGDLYRDTMQRTTGELVDSGFASSNLAADSLQRGAYDAQSRFLTDALAGLAGKESDLINARFGRQSQNVNNLLNAFNTLGANQGLNTVLGGVLNPNAAGLFNDPQSIAMINEMQQNQAGNRRADQSMIDSILGRPVQIMPGTGASGKAGGGGMNWAGGLSGALGGAGTGATIGSVVPGIGTAIGAGVGGLIGGLGGLFR
jgi:hypothetical protein